MTCRIDVDNAVVRTSPASLLLLILMVVATATSFLVPPAQAFGQPELARIIFWHLPCAIITTGLVFCSTWFGYKYLSSRDVDWDVRNGAAVELGFVFACLTMATGILFSKVQ